MATPAGRSGSTSPSRRQTPPPSDPGSSATTSQRPLGHAPRPHAIRNLNRHSGLTNPLRIDFCIFSIAGLMTGLGWRACGHHQRNGEDGQAFRTADQFLRAHRRGGDVVQREGAGVRKEAGRLTTYVKCRKLLPGAARRQSSVATPDSLQRLESDRGYGIRGQVRP
jgi:hypothetical protein